MYPSIVEDCLLKHPNIQEAVAFGVPVNTYEQEVCAWVRLKEVKAETSEDEVVKHCASLLIDYQVPRFVKFVERFPINRLGKYVRTEMSAIYKKELAL